MDPTQALDLLCRTSREGVRRDAPDLTARQMAILLQIYMTPPPHTVRHLAERLNISKPAVTRALDRLEELDLARRRPDLDDRRSVLLHRTVTGSQFLREYGERMADTYRDIAGGAGGNIQPD